MKRRRWTMNATSTMSLLQRRVLYVAVNVVHHVRRPRHWTSRRLLTMMRRQVEAAGSSGFAFVEPVPMAVSRAKLSVHHVSCARAQYNDPRL